MTMRIEGRFLRSAFARRVFFLFMLSAFVPVVMLAALSYGHIRGVVSDYAQRQLVQAGSAHARALYDRLLGAHFILNANAAEIRSGYKVTNADPFPLQRVFRRTYLVADDKAALQRSGPPLGEDPPRIDFRVAAHLAKGEVALLLPKSGPLERRPWLAVAINPAQAGGGVLVAELDPAYLWGDREEISYQIDICVLGGEAMVLYCSNDKVGVAAASVTLRGADTPAGKASISFH